MNLGEPKKISLDVWKIHVHVQNIILGLCIFTKITDLGYFGKAIKKSGAIFINQNILFLHISKII